MDWEFIFLPIIQILIYLLIIFVLFGIPALCGACFMLCAVMFFVSPKKSKKKTLWGVLSILSGTTIAALVGMLCYFIISLATTPITFM